MKTDSYILHAPSEGVSANLAHICREGGLGENILRAGMNQDSFTFLIASVACTLAKQDQGPEQISAVLRSISAANASAASQALAKCEIEWDDAPLAKDGKSKMRQSVSDYWKSLGAGRTAAPSLKVLGL